MMITICVCALMEKLAFRSVSAVLEVDLGFLGSHALRAHVCERELVMMGECCTPARLVLRMEPLQG